MYADRVETGSNRSIADRINGDSTGDSDRRRKFTGKRQRKEDDHLKWEHDLFNQNEPQISNPKVGAQDLRLKLQKKGLHPMSQGSLSPAVPDLRELLSKSQPANNNAPNPKINPPRRAAVVESSGLETKKVANRSSKRKTQQKVDTSIDGFLQSLDLEKYLVTFRVEEVDMTALVHMTDGDLKALGIPMGPRKKILLALDTV